MIIKVKYKNNSYDNVNTYLLNQFLAEGKVSQFYRYSEERWVTVGCDPIRIGSGLYDGLEKRGWSIENIIRR